MITTDATSFVKYAARLDVEAPGWWRDELAGMSGPLREAALARRRDQAGYVPRIGEEH